MALLKIVVGVRGNGPVRIDPQVEHLADQEVVIGPRPDDVEVAYGRSVEIMTFLKVERVQIFV